MYQTSSDEISFKLKTTRLTPIILSGENKRILFEDKTQPNKI